MSAAGHDAGHRYAARLVGSFHLSGPDGEDSTPRSRRARALVAYLILTPPHAASRETLAALLWGERGEKQARSSLRQALFELRPLACSHRPLPVPLLTVTRADVRLTRSAIATDADRFDRAAAEEDVAGLVTLFGEPDALLLGDMGDLDPAFDEWLALQRSEWRDARRASALRACCGGAANRAPAQALRLAQRVALADPLDEAAAVVVMERAHAGGDIATIRRAFATLSQALRQELGIAPSRATAAAYERLAATVEPPPATATGPALGRPENAPPSSRKVRLRPWVGLGAAVALVAGLSLGSVEKKGSRSEKVAGKAVAARPLPSDPTAAALFLQARDDAAERSAGSLNRAVTELQRVTHLQPRFAPGYAALAEAYLLAGEAGSLPQDVAFDGAEHAADRAQALDPELSAAHRAKGFILYWWKHRAGPAGVEFRHAIRIDPAEALTHFWYANVLTDAGQEAAATREFDRARLADPGSDQIGADYAWALWTFGREDEARARLDAIIAARPNNVEAFDCAATVALARGDDVAFLASYRRRAVLRGEPTLIAHAGLLAEAYRRGGSGGLLAALVSDELAEQRDTPYPDHADAAFYASLGGSRALVLRILDRAMAAQERWGGAGYFRRERAMWTGDSAVLSALDRLVGDRVEG